MGHPPSGERGSHRRRRRYRRRPGRRSRPARLWPHPRCGRRLSGCRRAHHPQKSLAPSRRWRASRPCGRPLRGEPPLPRRPHHARCQPCAPWVRLGDRPPRTLRHPPEGRSLDAPRLLCVALLPSCFVHHPSCTPSSISTPGKTHWAPLLPFAESFFLGPGFLLLPLAGLADFIAFPTAFLVNILTTVFTTTFPIPPMWLPIPSFLQT